LSRDWNLGSPTPGRSVNENWDNIKRIFTKVSQEVLGYQEDQRKDYISDETWKFIEYSRAGSGLQRAQQKGQAPSLKRLEKISGWPC
jgi:hypothetical protein